MLISVLGFGSIWTRREAKPTVGSGHFPVAAVAYYNTTGVLVANKLRYRPCVYGVARFNASSGFRPDCVHQMVEKVFDCEPPCVWSGHNKVLFKSLLRRPERPDAYLLTVTEEESGGIMRERAGGWLHHEGRLISFSECKERQEAMLVMPAYTWIRGRLGTFFLEPDAQKPWRARLILSAAV